MRDRGMNVDEAADLLETYVSKMNGVFTVGDLKYLSRTGRIKGSVAVVGNMLKSNRFCVEVKMAILFPTRMSAGARPF